MIPLAGGVRVWLATGHTDMRKGMQGLALLVQERLGRDPHGGDLYVFRGRAGGLVKVLWHDGIGMSLYRSEEHTSELQSLMRISYAVFCLKQNHKPLPRYIYSSAIN